MCQKCTGRGISGVSAEGRGSVVDPNPFPTSASATKSSAISNSFLLTSPSSTYCACATGVNPSEGGIRWQREQAQGNCIRCGWAAARIKKLRSGAESQKKQEVSWEKGWESLRFDTQVCSLYLCMWEAASRCRSPDTCSFRHPPWRSRQNTSTPPRPRTGTPPPAPPHWPHGGGGHRTPLYNSPDGTTHELHTICLLPQNFH